MSRKKKTYFEESLAKNMNSYYEYRNRLTELSISMFDWLNVPDTIDARYIEMELLMNGAVVWFNDEVIGNLCLSYVQGGNFDVYGYPIRGRAYSRYNNFQKEVSDKDSVIIWNNLLRTNSIASIETFARRLALLDRIIDVNANAQKTPALIQADEKQRLSLLNLYKEWDGNTPVIFGDKNLDLSALGCIKTDAPYVADKLYTLKTQIWNEALTYLGISNINVQKKERLITDEVTRNMGGTIASRHSRLESRRTGANKVNKMFGTNIVVNYREGFQACAEDAESDTLEDEEHDANRGDVDYE